MFNALLDKLTAWVSPDLVPELNSARAVAALLVRIAKADNHYAYEEIAEIDAILARAQGLSQIEAMKLRAVAEKIEATAPDTETFTRLVQGHTPYEERLALFEALWAVSLADRKLRDEERAFLNHVAGALGIRDEDATAAAARHGAG